MISRIRFKRWYVEWMITRLYTKYCTETAGREETLREFDWWFQLATPTIHKFGVSMNGIPCEILP